MKILLYSRAGSFHTAEAVNTLLDTLAGSGMEFAVNREFADLVAQLTGSALSSEQIYDASDASLSKDAVAVSYGGDGTFLECVKTLGLDGVPILGVNSGRLGFLANVPVDGMARALEDLKSGRYTTEPRTLLDVAGDFPHPLAHPYAFNEFSVQRGGTGMIAVETYVNDEMVATYWGDGVILSTPAGSTAYSLSVGGPVVAPGCGCFVLSPIAPHNLTMRPVVVPDDSAVSFRIRSRGEECFVTLDSSSWKVPDGSRFEAGRAKNSVFLVKLQNISFYDTLRNKMMWGFDRRDQNNT